MKKKNKKIERELTWFDFRGLHPQEKYFNGFILILRFVYYNKLIEGYSQQTKSQINYALNQSYNSTIQVD